MKLPDFGRKDNPIRMSSLPMLLQCQGFHVLRQLEDDTAGIAAINGTCIGRAVELWHNKDGGALAKSLGENPEAEETLITNVFNEYVIDPRNSALASRRVLPEYQEQQVNVRLRGKSGYFYLRGHVDQIREENGRLWVWDLKNGTMYGGAQMVNAYAAQQAAYAVGMSELLGEPVGYGGIIRLRGYIGRNNLKLEVDERPVFFEAKWSLERCKLFLENITRSLDDIRRGQVRISPGTQCTFCPAGGVYNCVEAF